MVPCRAKDRMDEQLRGGRCAVQQSQGVQLKEIYRVRTTGRAIECRLRIYLSHAVGNQDLTRYL
jgi:hypothetical protein